MVSRAATEADKKIDIYAFAMIAFECACPGHLFPRMSRDEIGNSVIMGVRPSFSDSIVSDEYQSLVHQCWSQNPDTRPTALNIVERIESLFLSLASSSSVRTSIK